ncbi:MAG: hypothetical protein M3R38_09335 [Actinomycetota bacterium]|nr:hypothetical protein [Actinomycetota bacterium]
MDVVSGKLAVPPEGYQRLSKELAASYGMGYRALYDRVRAGKVPGVVQVKGKGGGWYLPLEIGIPRVRASITPEVEGRILDALSRKQKPAAIAQRERVGVSTVYALKDRHYEALAEDERRRREEQEALDNLPELGTLHRGVGAEHNTAITPVELDEINPEYLASIVRFEGYFDPERNTFYVSPALVREIAAWEDVRQKRLEELYRSTMITTGTDTALKD